MAGSTVKTIGRDKSFAYAASFSVLPIASDARALPVLTVAVTAGLSSPYSFRSVGSVATSFFIWPDERRVTRFSTAPWSARAVTG